MVREGLKQITMSEGPVNNVENTLLPSIILGNIVNKIPFFCEKIQFSNMRYYTFR